ncbi:PREDICTED: uncharacterized protein LOC109228489 [Nicotiana attenuata]|uniref:Uncharacterized protein n=1 Tax=Nicotiana attenuata TaxID=49451 RepID=A0A1J6I5W5_NICAT|nr:PREDICTED: uncharacterized protein LOC109228489 [Nicotiana attenuata]OIS99897.1 hypothetical protein A4A49_04062 [Nicotiana attenuata]
MNLLHLHPIPQCSLNVSSPTISRFQIGSYSSFPPSSQSLTLRRSFSSRATGPIQIPARDRVIDFGKYKGKMLGTLPSKYLKWVSKNLRARDFEEWAKLADEVLSDSVYKDRIEWEFAQNLLNGDVSASTQSAVSELLEISTRFGWDNEDKLGWSKIDYELLGTSKGGRIPRLSDYTNLKGTAEVDSSETGEGEKDTRERRRERIRLQRRKNDSGSRLQSSTMTERTRNLQNPENHTDYNTINKDHSVSNNGSPFPGREALLKKALSLGSRKQF